MTKPLRSLLPHGLALALCAAAPVPAGAAAGTEIALNEAGAAPDWVQMLPRGPLVAGRDGRKFYIHDPAAVIAATQPWLPLVMDFEHASELPGTDPKPAAGWIVDLDVRDGMVWGKVEWTERARNMVAGREYRFISPAFLHAKNDRADIVRLTSAGLVHVPNFHLTALNSANAEPVMDKEILNALGLSAEATVAAVVLAINALKADKQTALNAADNPSLERFVPKAQHDGVLASLNAANAELQTIKDKARNDAAVSLVDEAVRAGKIAPAAKDSFVKMALNSFDDAKAAIDGMPSVLKPGEQQETAKPADQAGGALTAEEIAVCKALNISHDNYLAEKKRAA